MGSFTEIVMSFPLKADTPPHVLAAFSSIAVPHPEAPELPPPVVDDDGWWDPTDPGADTSEIWAHDWGSWIGEGMTGVYIQSDVGATLTWSIGRSWVVTSRASLKVYPDDLAPKLEWLGAFIAEGDIERPFLVGYMKHEYEKRPWLLWCNGAQLHSEDLNGEGDRD